MNSDSIEPPPNTELSVAVGLGADGHDTATTTDGPKSRA
jgi:hypothetical protein